MGTVRPTYLSNKRLCPCDDRIAPISHKEGDSRSSYIIMNKFTCLRVCYFLHSTLGWQYKVPRIGAMDSDYPSISSIRNVEATFMVQGDSDNEIDRLIVTNYLLH